MRQSLGHAVQDGDLRSWAPHAMALFYAWGSLLALPVALLPGRSVPALSLVIAVSGLLCAAAIVVWARHLTLGRLNAALAVGSVCITLGTASARVLTGPDAVLFVWVGLYAGFFLSHRALAGHLVLIAVLYAFVQLGYPGAAGPTGEVAQRVVLVVGSVTAAGVWSAVMRRVCEALLSRHRRLARTDALSGLANRGELLRLGAERLAAREPFALLLIDLDDFKRVNDGLGHAAGDELLRTVAARLDRLARSGDVVARLGGDEFALLIGAVGITAASGIAVRVDRAVTAPIALADETVTVGVSIGVALLRPEHAHIEDLVRDADLAMYAAKRDGGGWCGFAPAMRDAAAERRELVRDLERAIPNQLSLRYQPMVDLATGRTEVVEALVRWEHPEKGTITPDRFIPAAERTGLIVGLGRWVLGEACAQAGTWAATTGAAPVVSVNLSPRQLLDPALVDDVARALVRANLPAGRLMLEITESTVMADPESAIARLHELRELGVRLAVDDFGTGHSSLSALRQLPVTELKLAREFVADLDTGPSAVALAHGIVGLAQALGLRAIAEGVEHTGQLDAVRAMGCDLVQGYLLARPLAVADLEARLRGDDPPATRAFSLEPGRTAEPA